MPLSYLCMVDSQHIMLIIGLLDQNLWILDGSKEGTKDPPPPAFFLENSNLVIHSKKKKRSNIAENKFCDTLSCIAMKIAPHPGHFPAYKYTPPPHLRKIILDLHMIIPLVCNIICT